MAVSPKIIDSQEHAAQEIERIHGALSHETDVSRVRGLAHQLLRAVRQLPGCSRATSVLLPPQAERLLATHH